MKDKFKIGIDYGGTKIEAILMNNKGDEIKRERSEYDRNYESGISTVKKLMDYWDLMGVEKQHFSILLLVFCPQTKVRLF